MLLSLSISAAFSKNDNFGVDYVFEPVMVNGQWMIKDTMVLNVPGEPLIPYRPAQILLPAGAVVKDVKVKHGKPIVQKGFELPWGQPPCTFSDEPVKVGKNEKTYSSDNLYPSKLFDIVGVERFRGFSILQIHLYPVQYMPKSQTVHFYERLTVEVKFGKKMKNKLYRGLKGDKTDIVSIVDNPEVVGTYEDGPAPLATEEYIIITNTTMQSTFQQLADWKANFVDGTGVYTVSWITSNYSGVDNQEKIRNFIIDKYTNNGTKYVLIGGDTGVVPYRGFYVSAGGYTDSDMAADMYYAHLDGTFNDDGDSQWAEPNDGIDWYAEVAVGRAPVDNTTQAQAFVNKVIAYEQMEKPKRVCFHQSRVQADNNPDSRCLAYNCDNYIPGDYTIDYVFEEDGTVSKTDWRNAWAANPVVVVHIGHGNTDVYYINYEVGGTVSWYNSDVSSLTNTFFPWTTSVACICGEFEASDCLAEEYVKDDCGAIAAIYNNNYGWFSTANACKYSGEFCEMEVRACWNDGYGKLGDILNKARSYMASSAEMDMYYRWCFYERNLIGDPETSCLTNGGPPDSITIASPSDGSIVCCTVDIIVSTTGCIDEVKFYIDGVYKYTDTAAPFEYSFYACSYPDGSNITIMAEGYCSGVLKDTDSVTITKDCYVTITHPPEGETVSGTVTCIAESNCDFIKWYIDGVFKYEDTAAPFLYSWDTTAYSEGSHTVRADGFCFGDESTIKASDTVTCNVVHECLGTTLLSLFVLFGSAGILRRR
ncbi:MAG: hypothetical protein AYK19_12495 [Theionarchaea archaeon DG-70-1]|nr:MAG: hypothetical protein AYK19_12495 [Theionarchaea archaeon DG-70-1]